MVQAQRARAVGFNHVALEVGDIEEALAFYGRKAPNVLRGMGLTHLSKNPRALEELAEKGTSSR